jgi:hypothetical protein
MKLKACVGRGKIGKVAHRVMSFMEWGSRKSESPEPADEENRRKAISKRWKLPTLVAG